MAPETQAPTILRFGVFEVDVRAGELRKQGVRIKLQEQPFQVLTQLLKRPGELVTREELRAQLWPSDTFVDFDNGLNTSINKLREALGDSADNSRFIETLPRRGYRFIAPVTSNGRKRPVITTHNWKIAVPAAIVVLAAFVIAGEFSWHSRKAKLLTEKDTIVLADFANTTGEPIFDETLKQGLRVQLEQSPFLNILSDQKVNEQLQLMGRPKDERLTQDVTREVCQRAGSKAFLIGTISILGTHYVIGLKALNCRTGDGLASEQVEAGSREHVLKGLSESATSMRKKLGESLATIEKYDAPVEATTASLEALQAYSLGMKTWHAKGPDAALPFFQRAVELDPQFAMGFARLGSVYATQGEETLSAENTRHAHELLEKVSLRERLYIEAHYYDHVTGELEKAARLYEVWQQIYPRDVEPYQNLSDIYANFGNYEKALEETSMALRLQPDNVENYVGVGNSYICLNRLDEARAVIKNAEDHKLESEGLLVTRYDLAFLKGDMAEMERLVRTATRKETLDELVFHQAYVEADHGRLRKARELLSQPSGFTCHACVSLIEAHFGDAKQAQRDAALAVEVSENLTGHFPAQVLALALAGDITRAEKLAGELNDKFPLNTVVQRFWLPTIRAAVALERKDANKAVELLREMSPYELGSPWLMPVYVRGRAYLMQGNSGGAAADFQVVIDHPGIVGLSVVGSLARLGLARAYALEDDTVKSRAAYEKFLELWKDADPDIPILVQAKAEYAKLR